VQATGPGPLAVRSGAAEAPRERLLWLALALFTAVWLGLLAAVRLTPPIDNIEQLLWSRTLAWGYYKHPPLPSWILAGATAVLGHAAWVAALLGSLCVLITLVLYARLLERLAGRGFALLALLAALCLTYSTERLDYFNHNTVMMVLTAATIARLWEVTQRPTPTGWSGVGLLLGLGLLAKYQMAVVALCVGLWWLRIGGWRVPAQRAGLALAALVAALVFAPHAVWLVQSGVAPLRYAEQSSLAAHLPWLQRPAATFWWLADWMANRLLPAWLLLAAVALVLRLGGGMPASVPATEADAPAARLRRDYLLLWGLGPALVMAALGLLGGIHLQPKWSTAFALWTIPALLQFLPRLWQPLAQRGLPGTAWAVFLALQLLLAGEAWYGAQAAPGPGCGSQWSSRDFHAPAQALDAGARAALGGPPEIVSGPYGVAGALALALPGDPKVLIDGSLARSPWVGAAELQRARAVTVAPACQVPPGARPLMPGWVWWPGGGTVPEGTPPPGIDDAQWRLAVAHGGACGVVCP